MQNNIGVADVPTAVPSLATEIPVREKYNACMAAAQAAEDYYFNCSKQIDEKVKAGQIVDVSNAYDDCQNNSAPTTLDCNDILYPGSSEQGFNRNAPPASEYDAEEAAIAAQHVLEKQETKNMTLITSPGITIVQTMDDSDNIINITASMISKKNGDFPKYEEIGGVTFDKTNAVTFTGKREGQTVLVPLPSGRFDVKVKYLMCDDAYPLTWKLGTTGGVIDKKTSCNLAVADLGIQNIAQGSDIEFSSQGIPTGSYCCWVSLVQVGLKKA